MTEQVPNRIRYPAVTLCNRLKWSSNFPVSTGKMKLPAEPARPPKPTTDATAGFENMSETVV
jgi:hypothetical protein